MKSRARAVVVVEFPSWVNFSGSTLYCIARSVGMKQTLKNKVKRDKGRCMSLCCKIKFSNLYFFATWWCKPLIFLNYIILTNIGCTKRFNMFVANTQFRNLNFANLKLTQNCFYTFKTSPTNAWKENFKLCDLVL